MYYAYFGLDQPPFKITPDTRLFFPGGNRGAVLEALRYAITRGEGIVKVVGEVGSGKTMLCRMLEQELPDTTDVIYLANPSLSPNDILHAIALELRLTLPPGVSRVELVQRLHECLLLKHANNRRVVMFVEEAQGMPIPTLEELRLLSNLETGQDKLLQIVLFGQPELDHSLAMHNIRQLKERITYSFKLDPFDGRALRDYVNARLQASGYRGPELFTGGAFRVLRRASRGLIRRINILADKALLAAYAVGARKVQARHVRLAARDSEFAAITPAWRTAVAWSAAGALALAMGAAWYWSTTWGTAALMPLAGEAPTAEPALSAEAVAASPPAPAEPDAQTEDAATDVPTGGQPAQVTTPTAVVSEPEPPAAGDPSSAASSSLPVPAPGMVAPSAVETPPIATPEPQLLPSSSEPITRLLVTIQNVDSLMPASARP